jgi:ElaA protein
MIKLNYTIKTFDALTNLELYKIMRLRQEVFVVEQDCPYLDADGKDLYGHHVMGCDEDGELHCYTRLLPEGISYDGHSSIGRVINSSKVRGQGEGKRLMQISIDTIKELHPNHDIKIGAQTYLKKFYEGLGFEDLGMPYLEDGIPHILMVRET